MRHMQQLLLYSCVCVCVLQRAALLTWVPTCEMSQLGIFGGIFMGNVVLAGVFEF